MRPSWIVGALLSVALLAGGCGSSKTTANCGAACDIWANCEAWNRATCMSVCESDGDWDKGYLECLQAQTCQTLDACG